MRNQDQIYRSISTVTNSRFRFAEPERVCSLVLSSSSRPHGSFPSLDDDPLHPSDAAIMGNCLTDEQKSSAPKIPSSSQPARSDSYHNKPAPALPQDRDRRRDDRDYSSGGRDDRRSGPVSQPPGNYGYQSPQPGGSSRFDGARDDRRDGRGSTGREPNRGPASPGPTLAGSEDASLLPLFRAVDKDGKIHCSIAVSPCGHNGHNRSDEFLTRTSH